MKRLAHIIVVVAVFASNYTSFAQSKNSSLQYTGNEAYIKQKVADMLVAPAAPNSMYTMSPDELHRNIKEADPHAYWLYFRMMTMQELIGNADDVWAWGIAMNTCIKQYNTRLGRKIGSSKQAMLAIEEMIKELCNTTLEMNIASGTNVATCEFKTIDAYNKLFDCIKKEANDADHALELYYKEFKSWFNMYEAARGLMINHTFILASYTMSTMEFHGILRSWYEDRIKSLELEYSHYYEYQLEPLKNESKHISTTKFASLINYFKTMTFDEIVKQSFYLPPNYKELIDLQYIVECATQYEKYLSEWYQLREQIALTLPQNRQDSYREITKRMYDTFYTRLNELKDLRY
jgi:hypothetical protein